MPSQPYSTSSAVTYALFSHETAVEAIWSLAHRDWQGVLDDEDIWLVPEASACVRTQGDFKRLAADVDLTALGIRRIPADLLVPNKSCYSRGKRARFHVWQGLFPPHSFVRVHERVLVSTPYFSFVQLALARRANRLAKEEAQAAAMQNAQLYAAAGIDAPPPTPEELVAWKNISRLVRAAQVLTDFMGTYRYVPEADKASPRERDVVFDTVPIVHAERLSAYIAEMRASTGVERAREVASLAFERSASPMETMLALVLTLPVEMGGFGLPRPVLNHQIEAREQMRLLSSKDVMFGDLCWPEQRVVVEYYGWKEHFGAGPRKVADDAARSNSLTSLGWTVLHVTFEQVRTEAGLILLARQIAYLLRLSLREPTDLERLWRLRLIAMLLPKKGAVD